MNEVERIKEIIRKDENFNKSFLGVKDVKTAIKIAKSKGFNLNSKDVLEDKELEDSLLTAAAGGKGDTHQHQDMYVNIHGNNSTVNLDHEGDQRRK